MFGFLLSFAIGEINLAFCYSIYTQWVYFTCPTVERVVLYLDRGGSWLQAAPFCNYFFPSSSLIPPYEVCSYQHSEVIVLLGE